MLVVVLMASERRVAVAGVVVGLVVYKYVIYQSSACL